MKSSLESKTVRPGLASYSFYRSDRHPAPRRASASVGRRRRGRMLTSLIMLAITGLLVFAGLRVLSNDSPPPAPSSAQAAVAPAAEAKDAPAEAPPACAGNTADKLILVSVSQRHLWACERDQLRYDAPVVTGIEYTAATKTPRGTFKIYGKQTDTVLTGSDSTGSWRDPVYYWMPFLENEHGVFGFHDATWRPATDFGNIDPNTDKASHGCINLSLATAKWLYSWAPVGTTVTVKD